MSLTRPFQDLELLRLAPDWPEWMERHFRTLQHIFYILRAAHVRSNLSEPGSRLLKYNRISDRVMYRDPALELEGFEPYLSHMEKLEDLGFTTEPSLLFCDCKPPPSKQYLDQPELENPWSFTIIVDQHLNIPIPDWYHAELDEVEKQMTKEDLKQSPDEFLDQKRFHLLDEIDKIFKKKTTDSEKGEKQKTKQKSKKSEKREQKSENLELESKLDKLNVGIKDGDPKLYEPFYLTPKTKPPIKESKSAKHFSHSFENLN